MAVVDILPPEPAAKHVRRIHRAGGSVTDANFVTLRSGAGAEKRFTNDNRRSRHWAAEAIAFIPSSSSFLQRLEQGLSRLPADMFSAAVALVFLLVFGLTGGFSLFVGQGHQPGNITTLDFTHVTLTPQDANGMQVLLVNGIIENRGMANLPLPSIKAEFVREGTLLSTAVIAPPVVEIQGRHSHGFSARIPHPGGKTPELKLSFASEGASRS